MCALPQQRQLPHCLYRRGAHAYEGILQRTSENAGRAAPARQFIFATTEPHKILPTILSRCQRFDLRPIPSEIIANHLLHIASAEGVSLSSEAAFAVAKVADGGMRDAQSMLDQLVSFCGDHIEEQQVLHIFGITSRETVAQALALILKKELPSLLHLLHEQAEAGRDMGQFLSEIISAVREILVAKVDPEANFDSLPEASKEELTELVKRTQTDKILRLVEVLAETEDKMRWSTNKKTASGNGPDQSRSRPGGSKHQRYYHGAGRCSATRLHKYGCSSIRLFRSAGIRQPAHSAGPADTPSPVPAAPTSMRARTLWIRFRNSPHPARTQQPSSRNVKRNTERRLRGRKPSASPVLPSPEPEPEVSATAAEEEPFPPSQMKSRHSWKRKRLPPPHLSQSKYNQKKCRGLRPLFQTLRSSPGHHGTDLHGPGRRAPAGKAHQQFLR